LPPELLITLHLKDPTALASSIQTVDQYTDNASGSARISRDEVSQVSTTCLLCSASFVNVEEQRQHVKSDWHNFNLKQKVKGVERVTETEFEKLIEELDESISGSGSDSSESDQDDQRQKDSPLTALLKKQARISVGNDGADEDSMPERRRRRTGRSPLIWFSTSLLPSNTSLGFYRALLTATDQGNPDTVEVIRRKQLQPVPAKTSSPDNSNGVPLPSTMTSPSILMCMVGGGHFAAMIVSLAPKIVRTSGVEQRQAIVIAHKTFHRYTTRRKQGGAQSANDSAKGAAHSAGASIRRYNETALEQDIRTLLSGWRELIGNTQLIFVRATGSSNRRILFGPYEGQVLRQNDPRNRTFPFSTRRATQAELMRSFVELTRVKVSQVDEAALAAAAAAEAEAAFQNDKAPSMPAKSAPPKPTKEEETAALHTSQLQALIRRSRAPALLSYLSNNSLSPEFPFHPPSTHANHHAPTPLHLASSSNAPVVVLALLNKATADPTLPNGEGKPAFDLAGDRATRDAFRVARSELGESKIDWAAAHVPPALTKAEAEERDRREKAEAEKVEAERRKFEEERLKKEGPKVVDTKASKKGGKVLGVPDLTAEERREEEARGMTPEMRMRLERERRARAAEERMKRFTGAGAGR